MRFRFNKSTGLLASGMLFLMTPTPAHASGMLLANSAMIAAFQTLASQNLCMVYAYDRNGNITARNDLTYGSQATWGSSVIGCFNWTSS